MTKWPLRREAIDGVAVSAACHLKGKKMVAWARC
jgi:hypothetical protein